MTKILIDEAAVKLALGALKELVAQTEIGLFAVRHDHVAMQDARQAITALKALAEQPAQQEPVAVEHCVWARNGNSPCPHTTPQPAKRTWVGLSQEERFDILDQNECRDAVVDAIEAKLKEKNNG